MTRTPLSRSRSRGRFAWHENVLAVVNCCYVAVCLAAEGASAPTGRRGSEAYRGGRPSTACFSVFICCLASFGQLFFHCSWGRVTVSDELLHELLPGPITVVFQRTSALNADLNPSSSTIGIRVPASGFVCDVARQCGEPLALTSANVSDQPSSLVIEVSVLLTYCCLCCSCCCFIWTCQSP